MTDTAAADAMADLKLASDFPPVARAAWRALVDKALNGADFEKSLVSRTLDNVRIEPLYEGSRRAASLPRAHLGQPWAVCQRVDHPDATAAAALAIADLTGGASGLALVFPGGNAARGFGAPCETVGELDAALDGVMLDLIQTRLDPAPAGRLNAGLFAALVVQRGLSPAAVNADFGIDPISILMQTGALPCPWDEMGERLTDSVRTLSAMGFPGPLLTCDARPIHEAGGSEAQELAAALASCVAYLRALEANGIPLEDALPRLSFTLAIDGDQFMGLAKLRALRLLAACLAAACGAAPQPVRIHAETAWRMMTCRDPWVNLLRATLATATAGLGGANTVTVLPHTLPLGLPDAFARRFARNTQLVLLEESNLWRVADPAAGSGAIEALTNELAKTAWALFQEIEREGGMAASLMGGHLQTRIAAMRETRQRDIATRKTALTGTSEFPILGQTPPAVLDVAPDGRARLPKPYSGHPDRSMAELIAAFCKGDTRSAIAPGFKDPIRAEALPSCRLAEPFEKLRDAAESGSRPRVFLASLGAIADHNVRSAWAQNLLAAGGIEAIVSDGYPDAAAAAAAFQASGAAVACMTSSDAVYGRHAEATARALKKVGARHILLAGRPGEMEPALRASGVDGFLFAGQDMVQELTALQAKLAAHTN